MPNSTNNSSWVLTAIILALLFGVGYFIMTKPDPRTAAQKISDGVNELPNGLDKASRQLESRTPGEKLEDVARDTKEDIKKATNTP